MRTRMVIRIGSAAIIVASALLAGCGGAPAISDPLATIGDPGLSPTRHNTALAMVGDRPTDPAVLDALHRVIWQPGYTVGVREGAFQHLEQHDLERLKRTVRQQLPRLAAWQWRVRLCELIADRGWKELTPGLVSGWAVPAVFEPDEARRPEYLALAAMHGDNRVTDVIFNVMLESRKVSDQGLRTRCWELLHRLGHRDRLIDLVHAASVGDGDLMMLDLQAAARDFGMVPYNRQEILWIRELRQPAHASFWQAAREAIAAVDIDRRRSLEIRDLPMVVSASLHEPELLTADLAALRADVTRALRGGKVYVRKDAVDGRAHRPPTMTEFAADLTWGDLVALRMARRALHVPQVVDHLFDFADRDKEDRSTEYGGIVSLDGRNRFEVQEFIPRIRMHDARFNASQEMFDAGYTALFHFHYHAQRHRNAQHAGPGLGDHTYAENTRTNCLVLTFVDGDQLNVDYYRHGGVVIDLGTIRRPSA